MSTPNTIEDRLSAKYNPAEASKLSQLAIQMKDEKIRDIFADLLEGNVGDPACRMALENLIMYDPEKAIRAIRVFGFTNSSALRKALSQGFELPAGPARAPAASVEGL